ncbi:gluconokinase [Pseudonocardia alaniniphila]|uniref:Gluconokinase n=1 Tax=Pseudonocardia alaniniphila TaxID=75291 RepID=A0ABS9TII4_9PSEU|nr:gluconokinase [Pseudonocardia alaniniphila]MCH6168354.1 gluconokinase [Pseudonocardia alaniniphila]
MTVTLVVMGVSGVGKSSVAAELVRRTGWAFVEGDDLHPASNRAKMASGIPLDDDDRWPWLRRVAAWIGEQEAAGRDAVVTCSALKRSYRDLLCDGHPSARFVHLLAPPELISARITARRNHYMPPSLLESQLATLEPLQPDEPGIEVETTGDPAAVAERVLELLGDDIVLPADPPSGDEPDHPASSS